MRIDRRKFIRQTLAAALGGASVYSALGNLQLLQAATRASNYAFTDYKALVCIFLYGGNDSFNMVVPYTQSAFDGFYSPATGVRPGLALDRTQLHPLADGSNSSADGIQYALHPSMPELAALFNNSAKAAIIANVGTLVGPVTQNQYQFNNPSVPEQLFSHSDQSAYWQSSPPSNTPTSGWGGRICDMVAAANPAAIPIMTSLSGQDIFIRGESVNGYIMNSNGALTVDYPNDSSGGLKAAFDALRVSGTQQHVLERTYANTLNHSIGAADIIGAALGASGLPADFGSHFTGGGDLGTQLQTVARLIWAAQTNQPGYSGLTRQVFFVNAGGYDTHSGELGLHVDLFSQLSKSMAGFYNALNSVSIGGGKTLASVATTFTASDFGRTMTSNAGGSDHGWGSHHLVLGGAVNGGKFYGNGCGFSAQSNFGQVMPSLVNPTSDVYQVSPNLNDSGDGIGRIIPTTSVDQYAATLAQWFGLSATDIATIFPNLSLLPTSNLLFV